MQEIDKKRFAEIMTGVVEVYGRKVEKSSLRMWFAILKKFDVEQIEDAFLTHISDPDCGQYMPKPADIVRAIEGGAVGKSADAWSKVERSIRQVGGRQSIVFDDQIIHRVISDMGGWPAVCMVTEKELPFMQKEFRDRYQSQTQRASSPGYKYPGKLLGVFELENAAEFGEEWFRLRGIPVPGPVVVGDVKRAALVLGGGSGHSVQITRDEASWKTMLLQAPYQDGGTGPEMEDVN